MQSPATFFVGADSILTHFRYTTGEKYKDFLSATPLLASAVYGSMTNDKFQSIQVQKLTIFDYTKDRTTHITQSVHRNLSAVALGAPGARIRST